MESVTGSWADTPREELTSEPRSMIDSPSSSDAELVSDSSPSSCIKPLAIIISGGGLVLSGMLAFIRSLGPVSVTDDGDSSGSSMLLSPVMVL